MSFGKTSSNSGLAIMSWGDSLNVLGALFIVLEMTMAVSAVETVRCSGEDSGFWSKRRVSAALTSCATLGKSRSVLEPPAAQV